MFNESGIRAAMPVAALAIFISSVAAHGRTWTDTKGRSIDAELSRIEGSTAIVTKGGKEVRMPLQILSEQDKKFVAEWSAKQKQAPACAGTRRRSRSGIVQISSRPRPPRLSGNITT